MKRWLFVLVFLAGCATALPPAVNVRDGRGYCPLCHEWHDDAQMPWSADYEGKTYRFCDPNCRAAFLKSPEKSMKDPLFNPAAANSGPK
jgi:YHS domain-containing protein